MIGFKELQYASLESHTNNTKEVERRGEGKGRGRAGEGRRRKRERKEGKIA